jgi:hypothetical protein
MLAFEINFIFATFFSDKLESFNPRSTALRENTRTWRDLVDLYDYPLKFKAVTGLFVACLLSR